MALPRFCSQKLGRPFPVLALSLLLALSANCSPGISAQISLQIDAPTALMDRPIDVSVRGLSPGQPVEVRAQMWDEAHQLWQSRQIEYSYPEGPCGIAKW